MRLSAPVKPPALSIAVPLLLFAAYGGYSLPGLLGDWGGSLVAVPMLIGWAVVVGVPILLFVRQRPGAAVVAAVIGAVAVRACLALAVSGRVPSGDAAIYPILARHLIEGRGLEVFEPFMGVDTRALFPPLYPLVLAGWSALFGASSGAVSALNLVIDGGCAVTIVTLGRLLDRRRAGLGAAWLYLMWPSVLLSSPLAQKEGLCALLAVALAVRWVRYVQAPRAAIAQAATIGVLAGLLALTQPGELPLAALFGLVALGSGARRLAVIVAVGIPTAAAVMLPWWTRNADIFGSFVPLTSAGGYGLWVGNNPDANGHWMPPPRALYGLPELAFGKAAAQIAVAWIAAHPLDFIKVTIEKALRAWGIAEFGASRLAMMQPAVSAGIVAGAFALSQIAHFAMLGTAAVATRRRRSPGATILLTLVLACLIQTLCFGAFFEFGERHRDFATPFLLLLALAWTIRDAPIAA